MIHLPIKKWCRKESTSISGNQEKKSAGIREKSGKCLVRSKCSKLETGLQNSVVSSLEHLELLILKAYPFLIDAPPPLGKLKMRKVGLLTR